MAQKKHRRNRQPQRRHLTVVPSPPAGDVADQLLFQTLRRALRTGEPLDLLSAVSGFLEVTDPRNVDPFAPADQPPRVSLDDLVESFAGTSYAETTAALTAMRAVVPDDEVAARIERALQSRRHPLPDWLTGLADARIEPDVWFMTHVLGDGDDYLFGVALPTGDALSAMVYVDHNLGTVVKDAFLVAQPLEDLALAAGERMEDPDQTLTRTDAATARAVMEAAIDTGSRMYPPLESDSWPMCRPLVEWLLRKLPAGGTVPERKEWSDEERADLAAEFFASRFGAPLDREDERLLLESVLWFGTDYTSGDPWRWSPVNVEVLLVDWFPRKILGTVPYLAKLPDLLRAYIRYCHHRNGIRSALTTQTLAAVDHYEPQYLLAVRSARLQGPSALLARMFEAPETVDVDELTTGEIMLEGLDRAVGGRIQLMELDDDPLPDEPFEWAGIADDIRPVVGEVLDACDRCAEALLDVEHRTAMRRFVGRAAVGDPAAFRRRASPVRGAAAVAWVICRANGTIGAYWSRLSVQELLAWFGIAKGGVSQRAEPLLRANGVDPHRLFGLMDLGAPDLLTAERRSEIIMSRDRWLAD